MDIDQRNHIKKMFSTINTHKQGDRRSPHKPLLVLYALANSLRFAKNKKFLFEEINEPLQDLIEEYGNKGSPPRSEYPFWRLSKDDIWKLDNCDEIRENSSGDVKVSDLKKYRTTGFIPHEIYAALSSDTDLLQEVVSEILEHHFPPTLHKSILSRVGLDIETKIKRKRCPDFQEVVLNAYRYKCAVCGYNIKHQQRVIGLEAAHIKMHSRNGPCIVNNGLALCRSHHYLFDSGLLFVSNKYEVKVSNKAHGDDPCFSELLKKFHNKKIFLPLERKNYPSGEYLHWHESEIFNGDQLEC